MLTAKKRDEDKVMGLKQADDYITKPFEMKEVLRALRRFCAAAGLSRRRRRAV